MSTVAAGATVARKTMEKYGFWYFFWSALIERYGADGLYFHPSHISDSDDGLDAGVELPWWSGIVFWAGRLHERWTLLCATVDRVHGWLRYEDDYGLGAHADMERPWWKCPKFLIGHFYVLKAVLCVLFCYSRSPKKEHSFWEWVNVGCWNFHPTCGEYSGTDWEAIDVGKGILRNWFIRSYSDSSC